MNTPVTPYESQALRRMVADKRLLARDRKERPGPLMELRHAISYFRRKAPGKHTVSLCRAEVCPSVGVDRRW